jgi:SAM-dependent methyltransferase
MTKKSESSGRLLAGVQSLARFLSLIKERPPTDEEKLLAAARKVGNDWTEGPYYDEAERGMDSQWRTIIWPVIQSCDFTSVVDLAAGHGRNSEKLRHLAKKLYLVDINKENIDFLKNRFLGCKNIVYVHNDGLSLKEIGDNEVTLVYSFDAMVHFDSDVVRAYLKEFGRILKPGGFGFCHYSNYTEKPTSSYRETSHWRNFMSRELFEHYAWKEGLSPIQSELQDWDGSGRNLDAITLFQKPLNS